MAAKKEQKHESDHELTLEMIKFYQEEFMYRHKHYWDLIIKFFVLFVVVTTLPIISGVLGVELKEVTQKYLVCFPIIGVMIAVFGRHVIMKEVKFMASANNTKYRIIQKLLPEKYQYEYFDKKNLNSKKKKFSFQLPNLMLIFEFLIAGCVILMIYI